MTRQNNDTATRMMAGMQIRSEAKSDDKMDVDNEVRIVTSSEIPNF